MTDLSHELLIYELWRRSSLRYITRRHQQRKIYDFIKSRPAKTIVLNCHRRLGKTFLLCLLCVERCLSKPDQIVKFGAPTFNQAQTVVRRAVNQILRMCPPSLMPEYKYGKVWQFPNGSELTIIGLNVENGDRLRGDAMDMCVLDEVREVKNLNYIIKDVIAFQFSGREDPQLLLASTPPKSADHDFTQIYVPAAQREGGYYEATVEDNKDWTEEDDRLLLVDLNIGTKDSTTWLREAMCRLDVGHEADLVIPEFKEELHMIEWKQPDWFFPLISMDLGYQDHSAILLGYIDFAVQKLIIVDEEFVNNKNTKDLYDLFMAAEARTFNGTKREKELERFGDLTLAQRVDLEQLYGYHIESVEKYDKDEAIASLRRAFSLQKVVVHPRCRSLIYQLKNGIWNEKRTDFERGSKIGHLDSIMALVYMNRMARWNLNPGPEYSRVEALQQIEPNWYEEAHND